MNRLNDDAGEMWTDIRQSVGPGTYALSRPMRCNSAFVADPFISSQGAQVSICADRPLVDVDSELLGITRRAVKCPQGLYAAGTPACKLKHAPESTLDSIFDSEDTRTSNPTCTLRGTGWNRWEWLCDDPQARAEVPFETNVNYRTVVKDNHRPLIPNLLSDPSLPSPSASCIPVSTVPPRALADLPPAPMTVHWRSCREISQIKGVGCCSKKAIPEPSQCSNI